MPVVHIIIPVYNEADTIEVVLHRVRHAPLPDGWDRRITVVDDASTDATSDRLQKVGDLADAILRHPRNRGKGAAVRTGFDHVLAARRPGRAFDRDVVMIQDADLEYNPADLPHLLGPFSAGARCVYGSRFGAHRRPQRLVEKIHAFGNWALTDLSNRLTGYQLRDMECGYKCFRLDLLREMRPQLTEDRFGIEPQMTAVLARARVPIGEVSISYQPRGFGAGKKIKWIDAWWALWVMVREAIGPAHDPTAPKTPATPPDRPGREPLVDAAPTAAAGRPAGGRATSPAAD